MYDMASMPPMVHDFDFHVLSLALYGQHTGAFTPGLTVFRYFRYFLDYCTYLPSELLVASFNSCTLGGLFTQSL